MSFTFKQKFITKKKESIKFGDENSHMRLGTGTGIRLPDVPRDVGVGKRDAQLRTLKN